MADRRDDHRPGGDRPQQGQILAPGELFELAAFAHAGSAVKSKILRSSRRPADLWSKRVVMSIALAMALHGWIILDKPRGLGSTQAVGAVKRALREAGEPKTKVGHGGTLDPLASGVLPIALGEATKLCGRMLNATKSYDFTIRFGEERSEERR